MQTVHSLLKMKVSDTQSCFFADSYDEVICLSQ